MLPSRLFILRYPDIFQQNNANTCMTKSWLREKTVLSWANPGLGSPHPHSLLGQGNPRPVENVENFKTTNVTMSNSYCCTPSDVFVGRMEQNIS